MRNTTFYDSSTNTLVTLTNAPSPLSARRGTMSVMSSTLTNVRNGMPANIILSPREMKHYRRWQHLYTTLRPAQQGYLPTATEYDDFQQWLKRQDSGYFSDVFDDISSHTKANRPAPRAASLELPVATACCHTMHPVTRGQWRSRCPVCTIDVHLNYMKLLSEALVAAGGRAPSCTLTASEYQDTIYKAWCQGKICTLKELSEVETLAMKEVEWSVEHPGTEFNDIQTATKALRLYWFEINGSLEGKPSNKKGNTVVFSEETCFEPGRAQAYYWRRSPRYEPGKYTIPNQQEEDGAISEDSEDYDQEALVRFGVVDDNGRDAPTLVDEDQDEDDSLEWEDIDSDDESSELNYQYAEDDHHYSEIDGEASFIVFAND